MEFEAFVRAEIDGLTRYAGVLVRDRQLAHDVLADALIAASARWSRIGAMANPLGYVQRIVVTTFLADRRKSARRRTDPAGIAALGRTAPGEAGSPDPSGAADDRDEAERLLRALPPQQRAAVVLRYYLDWQDAEIAGALGCAPATVRSHLSHALATLRSITVAPDDGPPQATQTTPATPATPAAPGIPGTPATPSIHPAVSETVSRPGEDLFR